MELCLFNLLDAIVFRVEVTVEALEAATLSPWRNLPFLVSKSMEEGGEDANEEPGRKRSHFPMKSHLICLFEEISLID